MDKTPALFTLYKDDRKTEDKKVWLKFNIGFVYFAFLVVYGLLSDFYLNSFVAVYLFFCYKFAVLGSFEDWLVRVVGEDSKVRTAFFVYCFCQGSQIVIHCIFENYYDWNLFQVSSKLSVYMLYLHWSDLKHWAFSSLVYNETHSLSLIIISYFETALYHPTAYYHLQCRRFAQSLSFVLWRRCILDPNLPEVHRRWK